MVKLLSPPSPRISGSVVASCFRLMLILYLAEIGSYIFCGSIRTDGWPYHQDTIEGSSAETCAHNFGVVRLHSLHFANSTADISRYFPSMFKYMFICIP